MTSSGSAENLSDDVFHLQGEPLRIAVFAGDASGDVQAAFLLKEMRKMGVRFTAWGVGGRSLREAGVQLVYDTSRASAIGFFQVARLIPDLIRIKNQSVRMLADRRPDILLAVDFGAFNLRITPEARKLGIPVVYWFPPGSWRKTAPSQRIVQAADYFISPFPWYAESLRQQGARADFLGHPLISQVVPTMSRSQFTERLNLNPNSRLVALLPGSRSHEVKYILPEMLAAASLLTEQSPDVSFVIPLSDHFPLHEVQDILSRLRRRLQAAPKPEPEIAFVRSGTQEAICHADVAAVCSGSATLEALVAMTPMVVVYRGSKIMKFEYKIRRMNIRHMAMPNILADDDIVVELRQDDCNPQMISDNLKLLLDDEQIRNKQINALRQLRSQLEPEGAISQTAEAVVNWYLSLDNQRVG